MLVVDSDWDEDEPFEMHRNGRFSFEDIANLDTKDVSSRLHTP